MIRKIIHIDEEKCNGCGACVTACHEGAIGLVNGKAKLMRDDYCDGFGDCLRKLYGHADGLAVVQVAEGHGGLAVGQRDAPKHHEASVVTGGAAEAAVGHGHGGVTFRKLFRACWVVDSSLDFGLPTAPLFWGM